VIGVDVFGMLLDAAWWVMVQLMCAVAGMVGAWLCLMFVLGRREERAVRSSIVARHAGCVGDARCDVCAELAAHDDFWNGVRS